MDFPKTARDTDVKRKLEFLHAKSLSMENARACDSWKCADCTSIASAMASSISLLLSVLLRSSFTVCGHWKIDRKCESQATGSRLAEPFVALND